MQISLPSHTGYSSKAGFTLTELLISCAIIAIVSTIVLVKYGSFDSTVLLKSAAYEIALTLREAQVRSVSVSGEGGEFGHPYGVTFTPGEKVYQAFRFEDPLLYPYFDANESSPYAVVVGESTIDRSMYVSDVCITVSGSENCNIDRLDISFRRPEFKALFYATEGGSTYSSTITEAQVKVSTPGGTTVFVTEVSSLGQISVRKE